MIHTAAITASVSMGGPVTTAARTSTTVPAQLATMAPPAMTAWPLSSASVLMGAQVHPTRARYSMSITMYGCSLGDTLLPRRSQDCCATWMTRALVIHAKRAPTVTPTLSMAKRSAPAPQATPGQPVIWTLTSAPLVGYGVNIYCLLKEISFPFILYITKYLNIDLKCRRCQSM